MFAGSIAVFTTLYSLHRYLINFDITDEMTGMKEAVESSELLLLYFLDPPSHRLSQKMTLTPGVYKNDRADGHILALLQVLEEWNGVLKNAVRAEY